MIILSPHPALSHKGRRGILTAIVLFEFLRLGFPSPVYPHPLFGIFANHPLYVSGKCLGNLFFCRSRIKLRQGAFFKREGVVELIRLGPVAIEHQKRRSEFQVQ